MRLRRASRAFVQLRSRHGACEGLVAPLSVLAYHVLDESRGFISSPHAPRRERSSHMRCIKRIDLIVVIFFHFIDFVRHSIIFPYLTIALGIAASFCIRRESIRSYLVLGTSIFFLSFLLHVIVSALSYKYFHHDPDSHATGPSLVLGFISCWVISQTGIALVLAGALAHARSRVFRQLA